MANAQIPEKPKRPAAPIPQPRTAQPSMEADLQGPRKHLGEQARVANSGLGATERGFFTF